MATLAALACAGWGLTAAVQPETLDRTLAVVAGNVIMRSDVRAYIELGLTSAPGDATDPDHDAAVLTELIERRLILDEIERYGVTDPPAGVVDERLAKVRARFPTHAAYQTALDRVGLPERDLRQVLRDDVRSEAYLADRFPLGSDVGTERRDEMITQWIGTLLRRDQVRRVPAVSGPDR